MYHPNTIPKGASSAIGACAQDASPAQSPIATQINFIREQLGIMSLQIDTLIGVTRNVLSSDPRQADDCKTAGASPVSCALEGELAEISGKLSDQINMLAAVNRSVQL